MFANFIVVSKIDSIKFKTYKNEKSCSFIYHRLSAFA